MRAEEEAKLNARIVEVERLALGLRLMEMEAGTTSDFLQGCVGRARKELLTGVAWARAEMQWAAKTEEERKQEAPETVEEVKCGRNVPHEVDDLERKFRWGAHRE